jgi:hypothetical protein
VLSQIDYSIEREILHDHPLELYKNLRVMGFEASLSEDKSRTTWTLPDGSDMEAVQFTESLSREVWLGPVVSTKATAIQPIGNNLAGYYTRVILARGRFQYRYPAGWEERLCQIQVLMDSNRGIWGEPRPRLKRKEENDIWNRVPLTVFND